MEVKGILVLQAPISAEQGKEIAMQSSSESQSPSSAPHCLELVKQLFPPLPSEQSLTVKNERELQIHVFLPC